jgi:hypothetical protein
MIWYGRRYIYYIVADLAHGIRAAIRRSLAGTTSLGYIE